MELYEATQQPPCPNCGSRDVRWRNRRWLDYPLNWLRYAVEAGLRAIGFGRPEAYGDWRRGDSLRYEQLRAVYDDKTAAMIPRKYWRCRDCRQKGEVFDQIDDRARAELAELEDEISAQVGSVSTPIDRDGINSD